MVRCVSSLSKAVWTTTRPSCFNAPQLLSAATARTAKQAQSRSMATWPKVRPRRIRMITCDVTGTLISFRGSLQEHYLGSAQKVGVSIDNNAPIGKAFNQAYKECCLKYPCFGGDEVSGKEWWKKTVLKSFEYAGISLTEKQREAVFQRIYSTFGSLAAYEKFEDTLPFLNFMGRHHVVCGVLSNADDRYGDSILPMLGITQDFLQFQCYSKIVGIEKPEPRFFASAMKEAESEIFNPEDPLLPGHCLHIGNDYTKDFEGARRFGMHAILLNRYDEKELAEEWKRRGAIVFEDLMDVVMWLGQCGCQLG